MRLGEMYPLRSDAEEIAGFNRWLRYLHEHGNLPDNPEVRVSPDRFPTHYATFGPEVRVSPEFKALLDRTSVAALKESFR